MYTIHEKRIRRAKKARAHQLRDKEAKGSSWFMPQPKTYTMRPGDPVGPKKGFFQNIGQFFQNVFKGGRA